MADLIKTPFGAQSTAMDVVKGIDLTGKKVVITGGSSGIGVETARALASVGADVTLAVRNTAAGEKVAADIVATTDNPDVHVVKLDLTDWGSIDEFTNNWQGPLDILINNAGVMALPELQLSPEGHELQFATNHLGHFRLTLGLHDALAKADGKARIVSVSSRGHLRSPVVFDDIDFKQRAYDAFLAYGQSKTANILLAVEATKRWAADGIFANALHPGAIADTNLSRHMEPDALNALRSSSTYKSKTIPQGAATSVLVATSPLLEGIGGKYFEDCNEAEPVNPNPGETLAAGIAEYATNPTNAERLWQVSLDMLGY